ncbi:MAG: hypothetical protein RLZZ502_1775 [Pseudomonadota bacterium]
MQIRHLFQRRLTVLIYHRVLAKASDSLFAIPTAVQFEQQLRQMQGFAHFMSMPEALAQMQSGRLPANATIITFDDGYEDNLRVAAPILKKLGLSATFFIATDYLDGGMMFNDRVAEAISACRLTHIDLSSAHASELQTWQRVDIPPVLAARGALAAQLILAVKHLSAPARQQAVADIERACRVYYKDDIDATDDTTTLMMNPEQLRRLAGMGMHIGAHTCSHPILSRLPEAEARREIQHSRRRLQDLLQSEVPFFAYPNGVPGQDFAAREVALVKEAGFSHAFSTRQGACDADSPVFELPRFTPWSDNYLKMRAQWLRNSLQ